MSPRLGSSWKFLLPHHRHSNPPMERRSIDLPEYGRRPRNNQITRWKQLRPWPNKSANSPRSGCVAWTLPKNWQYVLLDRWHSISGTVFCNLIIIMKNVASCISDQTNWGNGMTLDVIWTSHINIQHLSYFARKIKQNPVIPRSKKLEYRWK